MNEFLELYFLVKEKYGLTRIVHVDFNEAYLRVMQQEKIIIRVEGSYDELEYMYLTAAKRLIAWIKQRESK